MQNVAKWFGRGAIITLGVGLFLLYAPVAYSQPYPTFTLEEIQSGMGSLSAHYEGQAPNGAFAEIWTGDGDGFWMLFLRRDDDPGKRQVIDGGTGWDRTETGFDAVSNDGGLQRFTVRDDGTWTWDDIRPDGTTASTLDGTNWRILSDAPQVQRYTDQGVTPVSAHIAPDKIVGHCTPTDDEMYLYMNARGYNQVAWGMEASGMRLIMFVAEDGRFAAVLVSTATCIVSSGVNYKTGGTRGD